MDPAAAQQTFDLALRHHQSGNLQLAETLYRQILQHYPEHPQILHSLGLIALQTGRLHLAVDLIRQALSLQPNFPDARSNLASALTDLGQFDDAIAAAHQAIALQPDLPQAHNNLGNALRAKGLLDDAIAAFHQALALQPAFVEAHANLGNALRAKGLLDDAIAAFHQALALQPRHAGVLRNLGQALFQKNDLHQAVAAFRQAITLQPNFPEAFINLGTACQTLGRLDDALAAFRQACALDPRAAATCCCVGAILKMQGLLDEAAAAFRQALALDPACAAAHSNLLVTMLYNPACDAPDLAHEHRRFHELHIAPLACAIQPHPNDRSPDRTLRIGYVSPDFRNHVIGRNLLPLFQHLDHQHFETICYADFSAADHLTAQFRRHASAFHPVAGISHAALADQIRRDRIDILVDLTLHLSRNRLLTFARKPAPVQVTFAGYPGTTGLQTIDYRLSDPYLDPPGHDPGCSEITCRLPATFWCYDPLDNSLLPVGPLPALSHGYITFGCLNNFCKINTPTLALWARVLAALPHSRLLLLSEDGSHRDRTLRFLDNAGIAPARVAFFNPCPRTQYLQIYQQIDISLDTLPYNGHTTNLDSLYMGVPVVTLVGTTIVGRAGLSQLSNLGLPEFITYTQDQFLNVACDWAADLPRLATLRATLRSRMERSPLMDAPAFARGIETAFRQMWRRWCATI